MINISELYIGIDLGTSNYSTAIYAQDKVLVLENLEKERIGLSFVYFDHLNQCIVSKNGRRQALSGNVLENGIYVIKRIIGRRFEETIVQNSLPYLSYNIVRERNEPVVIIQQEDGSNNRYTPVDISSIILANIKNDINKKFGEIDIIRAVITVPSTFNISQRKATVEAAQSAGIEVLKLINNPSAIISRYLFEFKQFRMGDHFLVCDLGGGTFDVAILKVNQNNYETIAISGDSCLGGQDFDNIILNYVCDILARDYNCYPKLERTSLLQLNKKCEQAKIALTYLQKYYIQLNDIITDIDIKDINITRSEFEIMTENLFKKIENIIKKCIKRSNLQKHNIKRVILCGGLSKIPKFKLLLSKFFGKKKLFMFVHPDECLAEGAALQAAMFSRSLKQSIFPIKILDVTPFSIGIRINPYLMQVLIKKNTPIPCNKSSFYSVLKAGQTSCCFDIYEGERTDCRKNRYLTSLRIDNITSAPFGCGKFEMMLIIDSSGLLSAFAKETIDNRTHELTVTLIEAYVDDTLVKNTENDAEDNIEQDRRFLKFANQKRYLLNYCQTVMRNIDSAKTYQTKKKIYDFCKITYEKAKDLELSDETQLIELCHEARASLRKD